METYQLSFTALKGFQNLPAQGDLIVYESANVALNAETRVRVKPDSGGEVWLKPGQWFRATQIVTNWSIKSFNGNDVIDAFFVIGSGDFGDANTLNKFTLDATFANSVKVTNSVAERVPVALDITQRLPVALDTTQTQQVSIVGTVNVAGTTVNFTNSVFDAQLGALMLQVNTAAQNPNGLYIELAHLAATSAAACNMTVALIAKLGNVAPATIADGNTIWLANLGGSTTVNDKLPVRVKIPAGYSVWLRQDVTSGVPNLASKTVLFTLL